MKPNFKGIFVRFIKKNWLTILLIIWIILIYYPSLLLNFSLIDDAFTVKLSRELLNQIKHINYDGIYRLLFEAKDGRVRPLYWLIQSLLTWIAFYNPHIMHSIRLIQLALTLVICQKILLKLKISHYLIILSLFTFASNFQNFENYYRIGPAETFQTLFYVICIYLIFFSKEKISNLAFISLLTFFSVFIKETYFLILIPIFFIYLLILKSTNKKENKLLNNKILVVIITLFISTLLLLFVKSVYPDVEVTAYTNHYKFVVSVFEESVKRYAYTLVHFQSPFFQLAIIHLISFIYLKIKKRQPIFKNITDILFLTIWSVAMIQLFVLFPWEFAIERYLILINVNLILIYAIAIRDVWNFVKVKLLENKIKVFQNTRFLHLLSFVILIPTFLTRSYFEIANFQTWQKTDIGYTSEFLTWMSRNLPVGENVYTNYIKGESNIEIFLSVDWHLEQFYNRPDISFSYLTSENLCTQIKRYIFDRTSERLLNSKVFQNDNFVLLGEGQWNSSRINYGAVRNSFILRDRHKDWEKEYKLEWKIYLQKENTCIKADYENKVSK